jgi:nitrogen regulatory protein PII
LATPEPLAQQTMLEIAVNDDFLDRTVAAISAVLAAGGDATSRVFVLPMHDAVQVYRTVRGPEAV